MCNQVSGVEAAHRVTDEIDLAAGEFLYDLLADGFCSSFDVCQDGGGQLHRLQAKTESLTS